MPRPRITVLTDAHRRILRALAHFEKSLEPAFVPGLASAAGLAGQNSLVPSLRIMERNGFVLMQGGGTKGRPRLVRLTAKGRHAAGLGGLPLLGAIPAGRLSEAVADAETIVEDRELLGYRAGDFLLQVRGDSMIGDGILDGDKVLLRPDVEIHNGEIAAVLVGSWHEATLKRVFREGDRVILRASNPSYPDVAVDGAEVKIAGVLRGLIRHVAPSH